MDVESFVMLQSIKMGSPRRRLFIQKKNSGHYNWENRLDAIIVDNGNENLIGLGYEVLDLAFLVDTQLSPILYTK